ncbi:MAG: DUF1801 domain-containing protein [Saprospiraceae bacterium]
MNQDVKDYQDKLEGTNKEIADHLYTLIHDEFGSDENKVWHGHPVWFLEGNPIVGYSTLKNCMRILFWSGQSFDEPALQNEGKFKAAEIRFTSPDQIDEDLIKRCLQKSRTIQWDYKNIVKRKGFCW